MHPENDSVESIQTIEIEKKYCNALCYVKKYDELLVSSSNAFEQKSCIQVFKFNNSTNLLN